MQYRHYERLNESLSSGTRIRRLPFAQERTTEAHERSEQELNRQMVKVNHLAVLVLLNEATFRLFQILARYLQLGRCLMKGVRNV